MKILFLSTWFPYPLNQGSKIRAFHLLKALADKHEVALLSFEDADLKPDWVEKIRTFCPVVETLPRKPFEANRARKLLGWISPKPSAVVAIHSSEMRDRVRDMAIRWQPDCVVGLTFVTAPYALELPNIPKVLDIDNVMARMLQEAIPFARSTSDRFRRWLAYRKFFIYEKSLYPKFDLSLVVTENDRMDAQSWFGLKKEQVAVVPNGVDVSAFEVGVADSGSRTLVFNGALTYNANYDAMEFFLSEIFPEVIRQLPDVKLQITGSTTGVDLNRLSLNQNVRLTGYLEDIRPVVSGSWVCVVPLRLGGGTRLKILEAMALGTPVISTSKGAEGLEVQSGKHILIADTPASFAEQTIRLLESAELRERLALNARKLVEEKYDWSKIGGEFRGNVERVAGKI